MNTTRIKFQKVGLAIYFSHLDLQKVMQRALKKSGLPVWYSKGFNPHIYMTFTLPLSLGQESLCESFDFRLNEELTEAEILKAMEGTLPQGIVLTTAGAPDYEAKEIKYAQYRITLYGDTDILKKALSDYESAEKVTVIKQSKKTTKEVNLKAEIRNVNVNETGENYLTFTALFPAGIDYNLNPALLVEYFSENYGIDANATDYLRQNLLNEKLEILQ
ncbi:MAG: TIGR03936 family radical SAM-associated protein [Oscillospiraceae bacterium]|nr:TIGR03936 family radical SAM-associated protein [Oscillospiraceae bacterium]